MNVSGEHIAPTALILRQSYRHTRVGGWVCPLALLSVLGKSTLKFSVI
jgi:hypothetical protein